ncbi:MAG: sugar phosphate isomerase/epimerase [Armatimonadetes bacterium]|nr:sugar phosphate isomerase/epimerase [Armatimonadota bacterium]
MRPAFYTYSYTDRLQMSLEPVLERIAAAGYQGIDISATHGDSSDPRSVSPSLRRLTRETAERLGLRVEAVVTHATLADSLMEGSPLDLAGTVDLAVDVGAPLALFHMGGPGDDPEKRGAAWAKTVAFLRKACACAESRNIRLAVDSIWPTWIVDTPEAMLRLFEEVGSPALGVNFDPSYLTLMGLDPVEVARLWDRRILHGHLKDHIGGYPQWEHRIPGEGEMDYARIVRALGAIGFDGALAIEAFTTMDFELACDTGYKTLAAAMGR